MISQTTGTVVHGGLQLDHPLELPDQSRVRVAVEGEEDWRSSFNAGLQMLRKLAEAPDSCRWPAIYAG